MFEREPYAASEVSDLGFMVQGFNDLEPLLLSNVLGSNDRR